MEPGTSRITGGEHTHLSRVLRLKPGERVELLDGEGITLAEILEVRKEETLVRVLTPLPPREAATRVTLYLGVLKGERMDWAAQKATELGARALKPVRMQRSVKQGANTDRLRRIALEAQKQCGRARCLEVGEALDFTQALEAMRPHSRVIVPYEGGGGTLAVSPGGDIGIVIGPEGGIDASEIESLQGIGADIVTLGPRILRAETAVIAALSAVMALAGEWS